MAAKKKSAKPKTQKKMAAAKKASPAKKSSKKNIAKKVAGKKAPPSRLKKTQKPRPKKVVKKVARKATTVTKVKSPAAKTPPRDRRQAADTPSLRRSRTGTGGQSGDLQGLSRRAESDSESVDELVEEGNAFEAGVLTGVEAADDADEEEVHTHEVSEDDVPDEYIDKDQ